MQPRYDFARQSAVDFLLTQRLYTLSFDVKAFKYRENIVFDSYTNFCRLTRTTLQDLESVPNIKDGLTIKKADDNATRYIVLFNDKIKSKRRQNFTLAHEVGHIVLAHNKDCDEFEAEANVFAAELLIPSVLVDSLTTKAKTQLTTQELCDVFNVSNEVAKNRLASLKMYPRPFSSAEQALLKKLEYMLPNHDNEPIISC